MTVVYSSAILRKKIVEGKSNTWGGDVFAAAEFI